MQKNKELLILPTDVKKGGRDFVKGFLKRNLEAGKSGFIQSIWVK